MTNCTMNRRTFMKLTASSFLTASMASCTHKKFYNPDEDIILSGGSYSNNTKTQFALIAINLTQQEKRVIDAPFLPHETLIDPRNKYRIYCFEKNGTNGCEIDLREQSVIRTFKSSEGKLFSGHAAFSEDGKKLYCIENDFDMDPAKQLGNVVIRDSETLSISRRIPTHGISAHDCQLLENQILAVSNTGLLESKNKRPGIIHLDLNSGRVLSYIHATGDNEMSNINNGHFEISNEKEIVIASAPIDNADGKQSGAVSLQNRHSQLMTMSEPIQVLKKMTGEALSISINTKSKVAAITHPEANLITFWSLENNQIVKAFGMEKPRGICQTLNDKKNGKNFIVSYGNRAAMAQIAIKDLAPVPGSIVQPTLATGEHIINWSSTLREIMPKNIY